MSAFRNPRYFAVLLAAATLMTFGACSKDKQDEATPGEGAAKTDEGAAKTDEGATKTDEGATKGQFAFLSPESNFVVAVHPQKITSSTLFKDLAEPMLAQAGEDLAKFKEKCGIDPLTAVESVVFGGQTAREDSWVISVKGITKDQLTKCAPAMAAEEGQQVEVSEENGLTKIVTEGDTTWIGWLDGNTMVMSPQGEDPAAIKAIVERTEGLGANKPMMDLVGKVDTGASVWMTMHNPDSDQPVSGVPVQAQAMYGSVSLTQGLNVDFGMQQATPEDAQSTVATMTQQLSAFKDVPPFGKYLSKLELKAEGNEVRVKLNLNDQEVKEMIPLLQQQLLPMLMMMGGGMPDMGGAGMDGPAQ